MAGPALTRVHVADRAEHRRAGPRTRAVKSYSETEIAELGSTARREQNIARLQIEVKNTSVISVSRALRKPGRRF